MSYANGYFDTSTNLYKYGARYYNPDDARWTQLDPSGQDFGYLYSGDNPVNFVDPSGYFSLGFKCARTIGFGIIGGGVAVGGGIAAIVSVSTVVGVAAGTWAAIEGAEALDGTLYDIQTEGVCN